ncbi:MAG: AI-2E family transporter [Nanoarchaeota archaeon]|nr:AI-2E family transporter [Nanoarchaeota archaeon]MBU4242212.1 AI-2E family transporter [Nanoarchaeota archaeon]MBU4352050.1 AI-2E family transporter [Nanoarchaeota archaeon]MBU4455905.1 AI-2E family transporter [Nanoarchaeota archaeon]MCG2720177.1 AI-2E family transporter [Nanoarchaeota archaeon]
MKDNKKISKYIFIAAFIFLAFIAYLLMKPFLSAVVIGLLAAYLLFPLQKRLVKLIKNKNLSAIIVTLSILIIGILGLSIFTNLLVNETITIYKQVDVGRLITVIEKIFPSENLEQYITQIAEKVLTSFASVASTLLLKIPELIIGLFISFIVLFFALRDFDKLKEKIISLMPVENKYKNKILQKFSENMDAVVYSTIIISLIEAILATIGFYIFGIKTPLLWGFVTFIFGMLPLLGPTTVWLPLTVYQYFIGNKIAAIGLAIYSLILISITVDSIFKPMLIAKKGKMHPIVALLGVMGGIMVFGIPGLILGPFLLSLFIFFAEIIFSKNKLTL